MLDNEDKIVKIAKALSDKTRIRILKEVARKRSPEFTCTDAEEIAELSQPTVSHHIKILVEAELLKTVKYGRSVVISLNRNTLEEFGSLISDSINNLKSISEDA